MFQENFDSGREESAQLCVYVGEEKVVDLWGSPNPSYTADTLATVFSSTKSLTAIAMAALHDDDLLSYDAKITEYWPEFGGMGKESTTVADLMRHEAGLPNAGPMAPEDCLTDNIKQNKVGRIIEDSAQQWPKDGTKRQYHAMSRGWIANELFRRIHPSGDTIGQFLRQKVSGPLGARAFVGVRQEELADYAPVNEIKMPFLFAHSLLPKALGSGVDYSPFELFSVFYEFSKLVDDFPAPYKGMDTSKGMSPFYNMDLVRIGESSSANGNCSAQGLAMIAAAMANGGAVGGVKLLGEKGWKALHAHPTRGGLGVGQGVFHFTQGGVAEFRAEDGHAERQGFYGWLGYGGSVFQWHPRLRIGFAYVPTVLEFHCMYNRKAGRMQEEVVHCAENLAAAKGK